MTKKQLIINAAIELFAEKGIESTSVQQITDKCGISKGAFYLIFKSKEELILAIIDYFMISFSEVIDQTVNSARTPSEKLYQYFLTALNFFNEYKSLALIFLREQLTTISDEVFEKLMYYEAMGMHFSSKLLDEVYGEKVKDTKYDLIIIMQSMLHAYMNKLLFTKLTLNFEKLADSLVEKMNILAAHSEKTVLTEHSFTPPKEQLMSKDSLIDELEILKSEATTDLEIQSIEVLLSQMNEQTPNFAIIIGVCNNLKRTSRGIWVAHLIRSFYNL